MNPLLQALGGIQDGVGAARDAFSSPNITYLGNRAWAQPAPAGGYATQLSPQEQPQFNSWVAQNKVPFDPSPRADYDMPGFWRGLQAKDPQAQSAVNPNDQQLHYPDFWKTPYHESFSAESKWAAPGAPNWNDKSQLVTPGGTVVYDEAKQRGP